MSLTSETLRDLSKITAMREFRFMRLSATAVTAEVTEIIKTVITDLRTETEEDWLNFSLFKAVRVMMNLNY